MARASFSPPSDSLYKFLAITGLIAFVGSLFFADQSRERYVVERAEHSDDFEKLYSAHDRSGALSRSAARLYEEHVDLLKHELAFRREGGGSFRTSTSEAQMATSLFDSAATLRNDPARAGALIREGNRRLSRARSWGASAENRIMQADSIDAGSEQRIEAADSLWRLGHARLLQADSALSAAEPLIQMVDYFGNRHRRDVVYAILGVIIGLILAFSGFFLWYIKLQRFQDIVARRNAVVASRDL